MPKSEHHIFSSYLISNFFFVKDWLKQEEREKHVEFFLFSILNDDIIYSSSHNHAHGSER